MEFPAGLKQGSGEQLLRNSNGKLCRTGTGAAVSADLPQPNSNISIALRKISNSATSWISNQAAPVVSDPAVKTFGRNRNRSMTAAKHTAAPGVRHEADSSKNQVNSTSLKPLQLLLPLPSVPARRNQQDFPAGTNPAPALTSGSAGIKGTIHGSSAAPHHLQLSSAKLQQASEQQRSNHTRNALTAGNMQRRDSQQMQQEVAGHHQQAGQLWQQHSGLATPALQQQTAAGFELQAPALLDELFPTAVPPAERTAHAAVELIVSHQHHSTDASSSLLHPKISRPICKQPVQPHHASVQHAQQITKAASKLQQRHTAGPNAAVQDVTLQSVHVNCDQQQIVAPTFQLTRNLLKPSSNATSVVNAGKASAAAPAGIVAACSRDKGSLGPPAQQTNGSLLLPLPCRVTTATIHLQDTDDDLPDTGSPGITASGHKRLVEKSRHAVPAGAAREQWQQQVVQGNGARKTTSAPELPTERLVTVGNVAAVALTAQTESQLALEPGKQHRRTICSGLQHFDSQSDTDSTRKNMTSGTRHQHHQQHKTPSNDQQQQQQLQRHEVSKHLDEIHQLQDFDATDIRETGSEHQPFRRKTSMHRQSHQHTTNTRYHCQHHHIISNGSWQQGPDPSGTATADECTSDPDSQATPAGSSSISEGDHPSDSSWSLDSSAADANSGSSSCESECGFDQAGNDSATAVRTRTRSAQQVSRGNQKRQHSPEPRMQSELFIGPDEAPAALAIPSATPSIANKKAAIVEDANATYTIRAADVNPSRKRRSGTDITCAIVNQQQTATGCDRFLQPVPQEDNIACLDTKLPTAAAAAAAAACASNSHQQQQQQHRKSVSWAALPVPGMRPAKEAVSGKNDLAASAPAAVAVRRDMLSTQKPAKHKSAAGGATIAAAVHLGPDQSAPVKLPTGQVPLFQPSAAALSRQNVLLVELPGCFEAAGDAGAIGRIVCCRKDKTAGGQVQSGQADSNAEPVAVAAIGGRGVARVQVGQRGQMQPLELTLGKPYDSNKQQQAAADAVSISSGSGKGEHNSKPFRFLADNSAAVQHDRDISCSSKAPVSTCAKQGDVPDQPPVGWQQQGNLAAVNSQAASESEADGSADAGQQQCSPASHSEDSSQSADDSEQQDSREVTAVNLDLKGSIFSVTNLPLACTAAVVRINMAGGHSKASAHIEHVFNETFIRGAVAATAAEQQDVSHVWACADADSVQDQLMNGEVYDPSARHDNNEEVGKPGSSKNKKSHKSGNVPSKARAGNGTKRPGSIASRGRRVASRGWGKARGARSTRKRAADTST